MYYWYGKLCWHYSSGLKYTLICIFSFATVYTMASTSCQKDGIKSKGGLQRHCLHTSRHCWHLEIKRFSAFGPPAVFFSPSHVMRSNLHQTKCKSKTVTVKSQQVFCHTSESGFKSMRCKQPSLLIPSYPWMPLRCHMIHSQVTCRRNLWRVASCLPIWPVRHSENGPVTPGLWRGF